MPSGIPPLNFLVPRNSFPTRSMSCEKDPKEFADIGREGPGHQIQVLFWRYLIEERDDIEAHMDVVGSKVHNSKFTQEFVKYFDVASSPSLWLEE